MSYKKDIPTYDVSLKDCSISTKSVLDFEIHRLENMLKFTENVSFPHRHSFYNLLFIRQGSGTHTIDFKEYQVRPSRVFYMADGQIHSWQLSEDAQGFTLFFTREFYELNAGKNTLFNFDYFHNPYRSPYVHVEDQKMFAHMLDIAGFIEQERDKPKSEDEKRIIWSYLNILLLHINQLQPKTPKEGMKEYTVVREFQSLVNQHFNDMKRIAEYADQLHINANYLNTLCKNATGKNAKGILNDRILLEAKRLLYNSELTISEVGYALNFKDNSYFSRFFKKCTGESPETFRAAKLKQH